MGYLVLGILIGAPVLGSGCSSHHAASRGSREGVIDISSTAMADYSTDFEDWVTSDLSVAPWSNDGPNKSVITTGLETNNSDVLQGGYNAMARYEPAATNQFAQGLLEFDVLMNGPTGHPSLMLYISDDDLPVANRAQIMLRIAEESAAGGTDLDLYDYATGTVVLTDFMSKDVWTNLKIDFAADTDTYDFHVNDSLKLDDQPARNDFVKINRITWFNSTGYHTQIDNVKLGISLIQGEDLAKGDLPVETEGFKAEAIIRDHPTRIRDLYLKERPDLCTTSKRLIFNGTLYVSPDRVVPRGVAFRHNYEKTWNIQKAENELRLVFEMPPGIEVTAGAGTSDLLLGPDRFPGVENITFDNKKPGKKYTLKVDYIGKRPTQSSYMVYFRTSLPAGSVTRCTYYLTWKGGRQAPQHIRLESIAIPPVRPPKRMFIMPWRLTVDHVELLAPNFPEDYESLGMNLISMRYLGHWQEPQTFLKAAGAPRTTKELKDYIDLQAALWAKARAGGVYVCYGGGGSFFPFSPSNGWGMQNWMNDPSAWAIDADGKPLMGWLAGHAPCPSYRGRFYQEAIKTLETSELLRRAPASFFNCDTEYYGDGGKGAKICFCKRCVSGFESWFKNKYPDAHYVDPFEIEKHTKRPAKHPPWSHAGVDLKDYQVKTDYPMHYKAWVEFKIEQFGDMFAGFKEAIAKATGNVITAPFDRIIFADWLGVYPTLLQQERGLFGPSALHGIDLGAMGGYCPPAFLTLGIFQQYLDYYDTLGLRRVVYASPATSGNGQAAGGYEPTPEHARYHLLETAMNGVQGLLLFDYSGLEGKQLQLNSEVFGAFALVDDLVTLGTRMKNLSIDGPKMHVRGLQIGQEYLILVGDHYVDTDRRVGTLTCPVKAVMPVYDLLTRKHIGELTPDNSRIELTLDGLGDRARFLYIGKTWTKRH